MQRLSATITVTSKGRIINSCTVDYRTVFMLIMETQVSKLILVFPILLQISFQNSPHHLISLFIITCHGIPNFEMILWKNNLAVLTSVMVVVVGIKIAYLVSLSTMTRI